ncbi:predicted protein [Nematostella vectensis]|uniref:Cilia- and flagella-associated protein 70 n=1 Tax=Nematostella vectensis TaxID=45351 RepID=A7RI59_NEMVE|nr:predicted protein [Nematostella vectensis]|eukprot:XP_001641158.1 predicted protein [Nematostella vectensis]
MLLLFQQRGSKGDSINSLVRIELGGTYLGESPKVEANTETCTTEYNYNATFECAFDDPSSLDTIAHKPIIITIIEVLPKDKKGKEEKTNVLGQSCIDLLPLLQGKFKFSTIQPIHSVSQSTTTTDSSMESILVRKSIVEVQVSVAQPLLSEPQLAESNLLSIRVDSAYSIPEAWQPGQPFLYTISLPVPLTATRENPAVLPSGLLRTPQEKEPTNQRKWCAVPSASGTCIYIPDSVIEERPIPEDEDGELRDKEDVTFRTEAMQEKNRVTWNAERRCFLNAEAAESLQTKIAQNRVWPVEIMRTPFPQATKARGKQTAVDEDVAVSFHGVAYVNMAPLLYPGVNRIHGAYLVKPFVESEVFDRTKRKGNLAEEVARLASGMSRTLASAMGQKPAAPAKQGKTDAKAKPSGAVLKPEAGSESDSNEMKNIEGQQYLEARTFVTLEIVLSQPLVPKRPPSSLARKVAELIPPRPVFARKTGGAKKAVEDYHGQVATIANSLLEEFRWDLMRNSQRRKFLYELNTSGKYFALKEQLKHSVVKIVREKYLKTTAFTDKAELQAFLSELYVFLVDQMHQCVNKFISAEDAPEEPPPIADSTMLKHFAREAEVNQNYELAAKYYQERLARSKNDPSHWFDYGAFCLLIGDIAKAEECFKETIALDQKHVSGLLMFGCVSLTLERYEVAETFFEAATCVDPKSIIAWTMLGLYYDSIQNDIGAERAFLEANRPAHTAVPSTAGAPSVESQQGKRASVSKPHTQSSAIAPTKTQSPAPSGSVASHEETKPEPAKQVESKPAVRIFLRTAAFLLEVNALQMAESALAHELIVSNNEPNADYCIALARLRIQQGRYEDGEEQLNHALTLSHQNPDIWALIGHLKYLTGRTEEAQECYERTLSYITEASDMHAIYLRLASIYLEKGQFQEAKSTFLKACMRSPSCVSWLGVGIACYRLGELMEAEDALSEANILNNKDPEVWAYLSLVCLQTGRQLEAEQSYKYGLKLNLKDEALLNELHAVQTQVGFGNPVVC